MNAEDQTTERQCFFLDGRGGIYSGDNKLSFESTPPPVWENLDYRNPETYKILVEDYAIDPAVADALCDEDTRPRFFAHDNGMLIILRAINLNPGSDPDDMISLRIWIDENKMISLEHRRLKAVAKLADSLERGKGPKNLMQCFLLLSRYVADVINDTVNGIIDRTDELEEKVIEIKEINDFSISGEITDLRRETISLRRYLAPMKDLFQNMQNEKHPLITPRGKSAMRELSNDMAKALEDLEYCREHITLYHEELQGKMSISMNRIMYIISIFTAVFLPLGLLTGLLGINVSGIPYADNDFAFAAVCIILIIIAAALLAIMKKLRWM